MNNLNILSSNSDALLLAEEIGWLHDYRKCNDGFLINGSGISLNQLLKKYPRLCIPSLSLLGETINISDLLDRQKRRDSPNLLAQILQRCHHSAHFHKPEPKGARQRDCKSNVGKRALLCTPFGYEKEIPNDLIGGLFGLPWDCLERSGAEERQRLRESVLGLFSQTIADNRRPINDVDLWGWGLLVGSMYKAALAGALLHGSLPDPGNLRWRLLGVRIDGLKYLLDVVRIPDLLARQSLLKMALDNVQELLEVRYPLGAEVFRDENGSVFVVPDDERLLELENDNGENLISLIMSAWRGAFGPSGSEVIPNVKLELRPWWGQAPKGRGADELPNVAAMLDVGAFNNVDLEEVRAAWGSGGRRADVCSVCGLRPQGPSQKALERQVCDICEGRRADRSRLWATGQQGENTIWTNEVADANGRLALIVGSFELEQWLDGSELESTFLTSPAEALKPEVAESKSTSFTRIHRIWETARRFWGEARSDIVQLLSDDRRRLKIDIDKSSDLGPFHVYALDLGPTELDVVWVPACKERPSYLLSADNVCYVARQLGAPENLWRDPATAVIYIEDRIKDILRKGEWPILRNPDAANKNVASSITLNLSEKALGSTDQKYATCISIVCDSASFMLVVPANKSLMVLDSIRKKYETEMGKVRNRLPIHLAAIFASRHTPIRALLEAGFAVLRHKTPPETWTVIRSFCDNSLACNDVHYSQGVVIGLRLNQHEIMWHVPLSMGDGQCDLWYPFTKLSDKYVHLGQLRKDDSIAFRPSTFDFEFLDSAARRFEVHYDKNGRRRRTTRPFYLEDLDRLGRLWSHLKRLPKSQLRQVVQSIEGTREAWYGEDGTNEARNDAVMRCFVSDTLAGAAWPKDHPWNRIPLEWQDRLIQAGIDGELTDLLELHLEMLKE